jgi:ribosomal protein S18 acetylase RimI-like enzyme
MKSKITIRHMKESDIREISSAFDAQGWNKTEAQYKTYYNEHALGIRKVLVAEYDNVFAGYVTILWCTEDTYFNSRTIPEIKDFNVLIKYRNQGVGTRLMDKAEEAVFANYPAVGLSVGLISDYGSAQRMYVKRGYIPTGEGLRKANHKVVYYEKIVADDDLVLSFTKSRDK